MLIKLVCLRIYKYWNNVKFGMFESKFYCYCKKIRRNQIHTTDEHVSKCNHLKIEKYIMIDLNNY